MMVSWYLAVAGLALLLAVLLLIDTFENRRFARSRLRRRFEPRFLGRAAILAPCKGAEPGLEENLARLFAQDYSDYELLFLVESANDPAAGVIRRLIHRHPAVAARMIIAGRDDESGQKVHNLRIGLANVSVDCRILAFVDSDAQPRLDWLSRLVARLDRPQVGAVTGYRWFVPQRITPANALLYGVNAMVASVFGPGGYYWIWGGSWAIRREVFERLEIGAAWRGKLLDDLLAASIIRRAGLRIEFEPHCVVASRVDVNWSAMFEFLRRQYLLGRIYARTLWSAALVASTLSNAVFWGSAAWVLAGLLGVVALNNLPAIVCGLLLALYYARGWLRYRLAVEYLPEARDALRWIRRIDLLATPIVGLVNWIGLVSSVRGRTMMWRGNHYLLFDDGRVRLLGREPPPRAIHADVPRAVQRPHFLDSPIRHVDTKAGIPIDVSRNASRRESMRGD